MKTSNSLATLVMLVIAAMLTMYLGYYAWDTFQNPFSTTLAYQFTVNDSAPADGYIVRDELVLPGHSGILELSREEGEKGVPQLCCVFVLGEDDRERGAGGPLPDIGNSQQIVHRNVKKFCQRQQR